MRAISVTKLKGYDPTPTPEEGHRRELVTELTELARSLAAPPGKQSRNQVHVRGEELAQPIHWQGKQWAVTGYGVERRDGTYVIERHRLWQFEPKGSWVEHMAKKSWVDLPDFAEALRVARKVHQREAVPD